MKLNTTVTSKAVTLPVFYCCTVPMQYLKSKLKYLLELSWQSPDKYHISLKYIRQKSVTDLQISIFTNGFFWQTCGKFRSSNWTNYGDLASLIQIATDTQFFLYELMSLNILFHLIRRNCDYSTPDYTTKLHRYAGTNFPKTNITKQSTLQ